MPDAEFYRAILLFFADIQLSAGIIVGTFFLSLLGLTIFSRISLFGGLANNAPSLLTSLGITFTFMGVLRGLLDFDLNDINVGITQLLEGMKVAFVSSVLGISLSFVFRLLQITIKPSESHDLQETMESGFQELAEAIGGSHGESMTAQLTALQQTLDVKLDILNASFKSFAEDMVTKGSEAMISALTRVIQDFNTKINEQLGDNFVRFNDAVGALLEWQKANKEELTDLTKAMTSVRGSLEKASASLAEIVSQTANIPAQMEALQAFFQKAEEEMNRLYGGLAALADMRVKAQEALPSMEQGLRQVSDQVLSTTETSINTLTAASSKYQESATQTLEGVRSMSSAATGSLDSFSKLFAETQSGLATLIADSQGSMEKSVTNAISALNISIQQLDSSMQGEVQRCVEVMARNITRITEEFVTQYRQLSATTAEQVKLMEELRKKREAIQAEAS